jgi:hypothetical protein
MRTKQKVRRKKTDIIFIKMLITAISLMENGTTFISAIKEEILEVSRKGI